MTLPKWAIFIMGVYGEISNFCQIQLKFRSRLHKKHWHISCKFQQEIAKSKKWSPKSVKQINMKWTVDQISPEGTLCTQLYKGFPWFTGSYWPIRFYFTNVPYGDSGQSGLVLQLFPLETIVTSNLTGQNKRIVQWKCFIQLGANCMDTLYRLKVMQKLTQEFSALLSICI